MRSWRRLNHERLSRAREHRRRLLDKDRDWVFSDELLLLLSELGCFIASDLSLFLDELHLFSEVFIKLLLVEARWQVRPLHGGQVLVLLARV